jgi:hypothetical protein
MGLAVRRLERLAIQPFIVKAATVIGWHRKGFRVFWAWKVRRGKPGRPTVPKGVRALIHHEPREPTVSRSEKRGRGGTDDEYHI